MKKYLMTIQYLGKNYCGFQRQENGLAIQQVIEDAIFAGLKERVEIFASGRTDAGVNAIAQTAHFVTNTNCPAEKIPFAVNQYLPEDIKIISCKEVPMDFHARFDVKKKCYEYHCYVSPVELPLFNQTSHQLKKQPNIKLMQKASMLLVGTHNFKAFMSSGGQQKTFERTIYYIDISYKNNDLVIEVCGNGFLYNMVRIISGTLIEVGLKKKTIDDVKLALESQDRTKAGYLVPAKGLFLKYVKY